jgi:hypothetical protein
LLAPTEIAPKSEKSRRLISKLNQSSKTKTARDKRKKDKKQLSLHTVRQRVEELMANDDLRLMKVFDNSKIKSILSEIDGTDGVCRRDRIYTTQTTLMLFVQQVLTKDAGCKEMVTLLNKQRKAKNLSAVSTNTTSYCQARKRIPLELLRLLMREFADLGASDPPADWQWHQHRVLLVDGLVVTGPDTPDNQATYPQPTSQKPGLGFPQLRHCALICLATGVVQDVAYSGVLGKTTGEQTLFRSMFSTLLPGDIVVADAIFESYRDMATLKGLGVNVVCDMNGSRESPFTGRCEAIEDVDKVLSRPGFNPARFTREEWEALPLTLETRMIRYRVNGRKDEITIVTTLTNRELYPAADVAGLYKHRWECEPDIRSIKSVMGMANLSCHTPEMLERELMTYYLAYNLVRVAIVDAAKVSDVKPRDLSFKNAKASWLQLGQDGVEVNDYAWLLWSIADAPLRKRPGRKEPRKVKRRANKYPALNNARAKEKEAYSP